MCRPSRRSVTRPASRSARRCCDTAGCDTFSPLTSAVAATSGSSTMRSNTARRVGSASVFITAVTCAAEVMTIYKLLLMYLSRTGGADRRLARKCELHRRHRVRQADDDADRWEESIACHSGAMRSIEPGISRFRVRLLRGAPE